MGAPLPRDQMAVLWRGSRAGRQFSPTSRLSVLAVRSRSAGMNKITISFPGTHFSDVEIPVGDRCPCTHRIELALLFGCWRALR